MQHVYEGLRLLADAALESLDAALQQFGGLLRASAIRKHMEVLRKAPIPGCHRTFPRGFMRVLGETGLGERVGRLYQLHLADWGRLISILRAKHKPAGCASSSPPGPAASAPAAPSAPSSPTAVPGNDQVGRNAESGEHVGLGGGPPGSPPPRTEPPRGGQDDDPDEPVVRGWQRKIRQDGRPTF
jgi:hypothetical protein